MAGGWLRIEVETAEQLVFAARRVMCWAGTDALKVKTDSSGPVPALIIPEEIMAGKGSLVLRRGGADLVSGYVGGSRATYWASNALGAMSQPMTSAWVCTASTNQPTFSSVTMNVGANPLAITLVYANVAAAGTVNIDWGDGSSTAGAAESGSSNHTYARSGVYMITITDASSATDTGSLFVRLPSA